MSRLRTLKGRDPELAEEVLSAVAATLLPNPSLEPVELGPGPVGQLASEVLKEIELRVGAGEATRQTDSAAFELLAKEMTEVGLLGVNVDEVKGRLADAGDLPQSEYSVAFSPIFEKWEYLGVRKSHVISAVRKPDVVQHFRPKEHFNPEVGFSPEETSVTVLVKTLDRESSSNRFSLVVMAFRDGYRLTVMNAFRVYHSEVDLGGVRESVDYIKRFVDVFGLPIVVDGEEVKFSIYRVFYAKSLEELKSKLRIVAPEEHLPRRVLMAKMGRLDNTFEVFLLFGLDLYAYSNSLRSHGVAVKWPLPKEEVSDVFRFR